MALRGFLLDRTLSCVVAQGLAPIESSPSEAQRHLGQVRPKLGLQYHALALLDRLVHQLELPPPASRQPDNHSFQGIPIYAQ